VTYLGKGRRNEGKVHRAKDLVLFGGGHGRLNSKRDLKEKAQCRGRPREEGKEKKNTKPGKKNSWACCVRGRMTLSKKTNFTYRKSKSHKERRS